MSAKRIIPVDTHWMQQDLIYVFAVEHDDGWLLVEAGAPAQHAERTLEQLAAAGVAIADVTDLIPTHIHLDHAGGLGLLARESGARVHLHPRGAKHMQDPSKLIRSSRRVFGEAFDLLWGEPEPLQAPPRELRDGQTLTIGNREFMIRHTPGHAEHHLVVFDVETRTLFAGDVVGVRFGDARGALPPMVPPEFSLDKWLRSLDVVRELSPRALAPTHGGVYVDALDLHLETLAAALREAVDLVAAHRDGDPSGALEQRWLARLEAAGAAERRDAYWAINAPQVSAQGVLHALRREA